MNIVEHVNVLFHDSFQGLLRCPANENALTKLQSVLNRVHVNSLASNALTVNHWKWHFYVFMLYGHMSNNKPANKHLRLVCWFQKFNITDHFNHNFFSKKANSRNIRKTHFPSMLWYQTVMLSSSNLHVGTFKFMYISHIREVTPHPIIINILAF